jgi:hypothetical protein
MLMKTLHIKVSTNYYDTAHHADDLNSTECAVVHIEDPVESLEHYVYQTIEGYYTANPVPTSEPLYVATWFTFEDDDGFVEFEADPKLWERMNPSNPKPKLRIVKDEAKESEKTN